MERGHDKADVPQLLVDPQIMAASYERGVQHHIHRDSDGAHDARALTVLVYLNPRWRAAEGGELRIHGTSVNDAGRPAPVDDDSVDIAPVAGRIVLFRSHDIWHAVRQPRVQRRALTLWVMGGIRNEAS